MQIRREVVGALAALLLTACAAAAAGPDDHAAQSLPTVVEGVGVLPQPLGTAGTVTNPTTSIVDQTTSTPPSTVPATTTTAFHADGNRVLLLGDSILASTARRYSNSMCKALVPLGWKVEVEAEVSRGVDFGNTVLASRKKAGWDVGVVLLGTNNGGTDPNQYLKELNKIIVGFEPAKVVLITVTEFRPEMKGINDTIRAIAQVYPDRVSIIDWNQITQQSPEILNVDGIHPTEQGRQVLADAIATQLGSAPVAPGDCLESVFHDDSAGSVDGKPSSGGGSNTTNPRNSGSGNTTTTVKAGTTPTTVKQPTGTTTGDGSGSTTPPATTPQATYGTVAPTQPSTPPPTAAPTTALGP